MVILQIAYFVEQFSNIAKFKTTVIKIKKRFKHLHKKAVLRHSKAAVKEPAY